MSLSVYWTRLAENKLDDIFSYYETVANTKTAKKIIFGIIDTTISLHANPNIGQIEILLKNRTQNFRYLIYKNYKIIYWINSSKNRIEISTIFDTRQHPHKLKTDSSNT